MTTNRLWIIGSVLLILGLLAGTLFVGVFPQLAVRDKADADRLAVEGQNHAQEQVLKDLEQQFNNIDDINDQLEELRAEMPQTDELTPFISDISAMALANSVVVDGLVITDPVPYSPGESSDPEVTAALGSLSPQNFLIIPVEWNVIGNPYYLMEFLRDVQHNKRFFLVHDVLLTQENDQDPVDFRLRFSGQLFVLLGADEALQPEVVPDGSEVPQ